MLTPEEKKKYWAMFLAAAIFNGHRPETMGRELADRALAEMEKRFEKKTVKSVSDRYFHAGRWHESDCDFPFRDEAVCNCSQKNLKRFEENKHN